MECRYVNTIAFTRYLIPSVVLLKAEGGTGERRRGNEYPIIKVEANLEKSKINPLGHKTNLNKVHLENTNLGLSLNRASVPRLRLDFSQLPGTKGH